MNTLIKCCICNVALDHTDNVQFLRGDSAFLNKNSIICFACKNNNIGTKLSEIIDSVNATTRFLDNLKLELIANSSVIHNLESKVGLLNSNFVHLVGATDNIDGNITIQSESIARNNFGYEKYFSKISKFIDNFESIIHEAVNTKLELIVSEINSKISQIVLSNQHLSDMVNNSNSTLVNINRQLLSSSADVARLTIELKNTRDICNELSNSTSTNNPAVLADIPNCINIQQELSSVASSVINNIDILSSPQITSARVDANFNPLTVPNYHVATGLRAAPKPKHIFVSRLNGSTTNVDVISHINLFLGQTTAAEYLDLVKCRNITRLGGHVASFKITVPEPLFDSLMSSAAWPDSTFVQEFIDLRNRNLNNNIDSAPKN